MAVQAPQVLATFHGGETFPIEWEPGEEELFWVLDDLHCPNPLSPLFFDLGGWWLTCDHMFRRFATPFAADWVAKNVNGYLYTAAIPADTSVRPEANEFQARYAPRVPHDPEYAEKMGAYLGFVLPHYAGNFLDWWRDRLRPAIEPTNSRSRLKWNVFARFSVSRPRTCAIRTETACLPRRRRSTSNRARTPKSGRAHRSGDRVRAANPRRQEALGLRRLRRTPPCGSPPAPRLAV